MKAESVAKEKMAQPTAVDSQQGVVMVRHFPRAFTEWAMKKYFSQFGTVVDVSMSRSRKTGRPQNYAFVLFAKSSVAKIAAEAMDNYLMFGKLMRCSFFPYDDINRSFFKKNRKGRKTNREITRDKTNSFKDEPHLMKAAARKAAKIKKCCKLLDSLGLSFEPTVINDEIIAASKKLLEEKKKKAEAFGLKEEPKDVASKKKSPSSTRSGIAAAVKARRLLRKNLDDPVSSKVCKIRKKLAEPIKIQALVSKSKKAKG